MSSDDQPAAQSTTTTNTDPWSGQQPFLTKGFERAETDILDNPSKFYPNSTVVPFSSQTEQSLQLAEDRALNGSPTMQNANQMVQDTLGGDYLGSNPYLDQAIDTATRPMVDNFKDTVMPAIQSGFSNSGRYGSGMQAYQQNKAGEALTRQIGDVASAMSYKGYDDERQRQMQAGTLAPTYADADYTDIGQLQKVGDIREAQAGAELQEDINRFNFDQQAPKDALTQYMTLVGGGSYGGSTSSTSPIYRNKTAEALGMAGTAAGIAGTLFGKNGIWPS